MEGNTLTGQNLELDTQTLHAYYITFIVAVHYFQLLLYLDYIHEMGGAATPMSFLATPLKLNYLASIASVLLVMISHPVVLCYADLQSIKRKSADFFQEES